MSGRGTFDTETEQIANNLEEMDILEFERRVKQFAFPQNMGYINSRQLIEAFQDT